LTDGIQLFVIHISKNSDQVLFKKADVQFRHVARKRSCGGDENCLLQ